MKIWPVLVTTLWLLGVSTPGVLTAQEMKSPTLEKIRSNHTIYIGHAEAATPFSYMDGEGRVIGYSMDLCGHIIDAVKARLAIPHLDVVMVPTTDGSRQMLLESGVTDMHCGAVTNTRQRQRFVAFSVTTYAANVKALVRKDSGIRAIADMQGKLIVTTAGTISDSHARAAALRQGVSLNYRLGRNHEDSLSQLLLGQADVMVLDDVLLKSLLMNLPEADVSRLTLLDEDLSVEPYGIMFRRNDPEFKKLVDETLVGLMKRGEFARIYDKWFVAPIPPKGKSLRLPMSDVLKQLILTPNDSGI